MDHMGNLISRPAYYGMKLRRTRMPARVRGHIDMPIKQAVTVDAVLAAGFAAEKEEAPVERTEEDAWLAKRLAKAKRAEEEEEVRMRVLPAPTIVSKAAEPDPSVGMVTDACFVRPAVAGGGPAEARDTLTSPSAIRFLGAKETRRAQVHSSGSLVLPVDDSALLGAALSTHNSATDSLQLHTMPPNSLVVASHSLQLSGGGPKAPVVVDPTTEGLSTMGVPSGPAKPPDEDFPVRVPTSFPKLVEAEAGTAAWHEGREEQSVDHSKRMVESFKVMARKQARKAARNSRWDKRRQKKRGVAAPMPILASADRLFTAAYVQNQSAPLKMPAAALDVDSGAEPEDRKSVV